MQKNIFMSEEADDLDTDKFSFDLKAPYDIARDFYVFDDEKIDEYINDEIFEDDMQIDKGLYSNDEFNNVHTDIVLNESIHYSDITIEIIQTEQNMSNNTDLINSTNMTNPITLLIPTLPIMSSPLHMDVVNHGIFSMLPNEVIDFVIDGFDMCSVITLSYTCHFMKDICDKIYVKKQHKKYYDKCTDLVKYAAIYGYIEILKWTKENGFPNTNKIKDVHDTHDIVCTQGARSGHLNIIQWGLANGCVCNSRTFTRAVKGGHLDILKWLYEFKCYYNEEGAYYDAAKYGRMEIILWLIENNYSGTNEIAIGAARGGKLEILKWTKDNNFYWYDDIILYGIESHNLEIVQWLIKNGCNMGHYVIRDVYVTAIEEKQWEIFKWLVENGYPNKRVCEYAAETNNLEMLKWARLYGCDWNETCYEATANGHISLFLD